MGEKKSGWNLEQRELEVAVRPNERELTMTSRRNQDYRSECATGTAKVSDELTVSR